MVTATRPSQPTTECPFCIQNPAYQTRYPAEEQPTVFTVANKFPAFVSEGQHEVRSYYPEAGFYRAKPSIGGHDVVVVKDHQQHLPDFTPAIWLDLLKAFQLRYQHYRDDPQIEYVMAIYNHGEAAAASITHPHAQIFASSIIPNHILKEKHGSERYYEINGRCVYCEMIDHERNEQVRWLAENEHFVAFTFFAARFPFEIWVLPKKHQSVYEQSSSQELTSLAELLKTIFTMLNQTLHDPALNFFIHSLPTTSSQADYYHWHLEIAPRVANYGGFEMGGGTIIDIVAPEKAAEYLLSPKS